MKFGNIESKTIKEDNLRNCTCKTKPSLFPEDGAYMVNCPKCGTTTAPYETIQEAFSAWENKILM